MGATHDKNELKRQQGSGGIGWLRSPDGDKVIRIEGAGESLHAKWLEVTDADNTTIPSNLIGIRLILFCLAVMPAIMHTLPLNQ